MRVKPLVLFALACALLAPAPAKAVASAGSGYYSPLIHIPRLGVKQKATRTLAQGPVVYYYDEDTIGIAAHNVTPTPGYGGRGPFKHLFRLRKGDTVIVHDYRYRVVKKVVVRPDETWVLNFKGVVLSACYPDYSARYRKVVFAAPVGPVSG